MGNKLSWCFKIKDGLKIAEPNERLSKEYLEQAKSSLLRAEKNLNDKDFLWSTVAIYYSEYYALYSFLQKIGITEDLWDNVVSKAKFTDSEGRVYIVPEAVKDISDADIAIVTRERLEGIDKAFEEKFGDPSTWDGGIISDHADTTNGNTNNSVCVKCACVQPQPIVCVYTELTITHVRFCQTQIRLGYIFNNQQTTPLIKSIHTRFIQRGARHRMWW